MPFDRSDLLESADAFLLSRYEDPEYLATQNLMDTGELAKQGARTS